MYGNIKKNPNCHKYISVLKFTNSPNTFFFHSLLKPEFLKYLSNQPQYKDGFCICPCRFCGFPFDPGLCRSLRKHLLSICSCTELYEGDSTCCQAVCQL